MPETPYSHTSTAGKTYYLNVRTAKSGGGKEVKLHFFTKAIKPDTVVSINDFPDGYIVAESRGMPILKKKPNVT